MEIEIKLGWIIFNMNVILTFNTHKTFEALYGSLQIQI